MSPGRRVCRALPTDRPCAGAIADVGGEAAHGARTTGAEVHVVVLDSSDGSSRAAHRDVVDSLPDRPGVVVHHLDEAAQRTLLIEAVSRSGAAEPDRLVGLLLPDGVSYGACTDRAFLVAETLGCSSVHRRDSDSGYQRHDGAPLHPIDHELGLLGERAGSVADRVTTHRLDPGTGHLPVALVGASFVGEMSVDLDGIRGLDPAAYERVVGLSAPDDLPAPWRARFVEDAFRGGGTDPFVADETVLGRARPTRVDMCNIAIGREVYARVPLPPARDTIGSDYFLSHVVQGARLPAVLHNRHIVNHHTSERRTDAGFLAYQVRWAKYLLAVPTLHAAYAGLAGLGTRLLDDTGSVRTELVAEEVAAAGRDLAGDPGPSTRRLDGLIEAYRGLGGRWALVADHLADRREDLLQQARSDVDDHVFLISAWPALTRACRDQHELATA